MKMACVVAALEAYGQGGFIGWEKKTVRALREFHSCDETA
jgi:hypothetical protein